MKTLKLTILAVFTASFSLAQEADSIQIQNIIDVDVVSTHQERPSAELIPQRIETLNKEKAHLCERIADYRQVLRGSKRKDLFLTSTGYYKPTISRGLGDLKELSDSFYKKVDREISFVMAINDLDYSTANGYVSELEKMREAVKTEYKKVPDLLHRKLR